MSGGEFNIYGQISAVNELYSAFYFLSTISSL